jgi:hypothetical protein
MKTQSTIAIVLHQVAYLLPPKYLVIIPGNI